MIDLKHLRTWAGLTQAQIAEVAGIKQGSYSGIEKGSDGASARLVEKIVEALTPCVLFISHSQDTPAIVNAMLALGQIDTVEHDPEAFDSALRQGKTIAVVTDEKSLFEAMIRQALSDSGLPEIPQRGIRFEGGKAVAW